MKSTPSIPRSIKGIFAGLAACLVLAGALAQPAGGGFTPQLGQRGKDVMWLPTSDQVVAVMLRMAAVTPRDFVVDLGSGDGKILIAAARDFGARGLGLEYNPDMVELSIRRAREAGLQDKMDFRRADIFESDFSAATVVTMYLLPELNLRLRPTLLKMKPGTRIVSNSWDMGTWSPDETTWLGSGRAMLWIIPAHVAGTWNLRYPGSASNGPQSLSLRQYFQKLEGDSAFGPVRHSLQNPRIKGPELEFETRDPQGSVMQFRGRIDGDRMSGEFTHPRSGRHKVEAQRTDAPPAFEEARATEKEQGEAARALGTN